MLDFAMRAKALATVGLHSRVCGAWAYLAICRSSWSDQDLQRGLEILNVGGGELADDNQVHRKPFQPPIFHRLERLAHHVERR